MLTTANANRFYYSHLTLDEKVLYDTIYKAILNFDSQAVVKKNLISRFDVDYVKVMKAITHDNPLVFWFDMSGLSYIKTLTAVTIPLKYIYTKAQVVQQRAIIDKKVHGLINTTITPQMSALAKQLIIHKHLAKGIMPISIHNATSQECHTVIGAFINKKCVCDGFARSYKLICDYVGLPSLLVEGTATAPDSIAVPHAWNITNVDGIAAHTDVGWDAASASGFDYFNLCDAEILKDHSYMTEMYPRCSPNTINYFDRNGMVARNEKELIKIINKNRTDYSFSVKLLFDTDAKALTLFDFPPGALSYNKAQGIVTFIKNGG